MSIHPKVSIILVNYNGYRDTIECLQSLREITYTNHEVIVIDNASTNESVKEIRDFICEGEFLIPSEVNGGFSAGNNIGIKYALDHEADYCLLLNNDTLVEPDFLSALMSVSEDKGRKAVITSKILYNSDRDRIWYAGGDINGITSRTIHYGMGMKDDGNYNQQKKVSFITGCCMLIPREIIERVGLLKEEFFLYCEDLSYSIEIKRAGYSMIYEPKSIIYHKVNASTKKITDAIIYYSVRNKLYIIRWYYTGLRRIIALLYQMMEIVKRLLCREYKWCIVTQACGDFVCGKTGKR